MQDYAAKQAARNVAAKALQAAFPYLVPVSEKNHSRVAAAKNIRIQLKRAFPGVAFSVRGQSFSGGDSIDVGWTDGPTTEQVDEIIKRYSAGSFDGMTDCYNYEHSAWTDAFGDAKYVHSSRSNSDRAIASAIRTVSAQYGIEAPSVEDFRAGKLWSARVAGSSYDMQSLVHQCASRRTWMIAKKAAPEAVAA